MESLVSIIIPVYNTKLYLKGCIDSALNQTYPNIEIITVNDGSTDNSLEILKDYQSRYPDKIQIFSQKNKGLAATRNVGINAAKGEWIKLLDSDDMLYSTAIEEYMNATKKLDNKKYILLSNYDDIDENDHKIMHHEFENYNNMNPKEINAIMLDHIIGGVGLHFMHRTAFDHCRFDESLRLCEDYDLLLKLYLVHGFKLYLVPKSLSKYRKHETSLTRNNGHRIFRMNHKIKQNILNQLEESERKYYQEKMKEIWKRLPLRKKIRRTIPIIMTNIIGESMTDKFIYFYTKRIRKFS